MKLNMIFIIIIYCPKQIHWSINNYDNYLAHNYATVYKSSPITYNRT